MIIEMRSYFAIQGHFLHSGGWGEVLSWAKTRTLIDETPIKIIIARGGEPTARVIAECTTNGLRMIHDGRVIQLRDLLRGSKKKAI